MIQQRHQDGCGIVAVAELEAGPSHELLQEVLRGVGRMEHRGGGLDETGDGAGVLLRVERGFFERFIAPERRLASDDEPLIVGVVFFLPGERNVSEYQREVNALLRGSGLKPLGWRRVPVVPDAVGARAREDAPIIFQLLAARGHLLEQHLPRALYGVKGQIEEQFAGALAVPSLAPYTTVYKTLGTAEQLTQFYPDLTDPTLTTKVAVGHRRFATNTYSSWHLVQPFRHLCHNGEINTITANCRAVRDLDSALGVGCRLMPHGSDSAQLDRVVEMMAVHSMSGITEALRRMMPPAWEAGPCSDRRRRFYEANRRAMGTLGAWEGPAAVLATDGQLLVGLIDRVGLRPLRYLATTGGRVVVASEMGAVPVDPASIALDGQLEPGEMVIADLQQGELILPPHADDWIVERSRLNFSGLSEENLPSIEQGRPAGRELSVRTLNRFGWTRQRTRRLQRMTRASAAQITSMGNDYPLAIFSENHSRLYSFLNQIVAVVTNPPIDPLREGDAMDTTIFLGRSPQATKYSTFECWPQYRLPHPVLTDEQVAGLLTSGRPDLAARRFDATISLADGHEEMVQRIHELTDEAVTAVRGGTSLLVLSDLEATREERLPLPLLLLVGATHRALASCGLRRDASIVVETGEVHEGHDMAVLLAYGATAVNPYAMFHLARQADDLEPEQANLNLTLALNRTLRRIMSKAGITSLAGYRGSALFEALGLSPDVVDYFIPDTFTRLGGLEAAAIHGDIVARAKGDGERLSRNLNVPVYRKEVTNALQLVARNGNEHGDYDRFAQLLAETPPVYVRDLLELGWSGRPLPLEQVADARTIIRETLRGAAMSHGALHSTAHRAIAAAFNELGALSNAGEGGEDERRNPGGELERDRNRVRQVASGRFGVDAAYLAGADEIEIKIGQGAKPGEGGHLPAAKVTEEIAAIRKVKPGVVLISPPPHHDIYSIEDLAQLIVHLRQVNPRASISVKVPSVPNLGTIAVGIAKAGADLITVSGFEGGTGAAYAGSILHAGLPLDRGVSEVHQYLRLNGIRGRVRLRADGGLKCGLDVAKILALGADEASFGTPLLVAENCVYCRGCSKGQCPVGIATQDEVGQSLFMRRHAGGAIGEETSMQERYEEARAGVVRFLECVAGDLRRILARLGLSHPRELVGRVDLLRTWRTGNPRWDTLDLSELLLDVQAPARTEPAGRGGQRPVLPVNQEIIDRAGPVLLGESACAEIELALDTDCHALGATLAGELARRAGDGRIPPGAVVELRSTGYAGQGLGFAATTGMALRHEGYANDTVAEIMSGAARVVVVPPKNRPSGATSAHLVGNAAAYGATGGELLVAGRAGQRFGVRNSGATLVCEGVGKYAFEYMTGGLGVVLGPCGPCVGSGMTGGRLFLLASEDQATALLHEDVLQLAGPLPRELASALLEVLRRFVEETGSPTAEQLVHDWPRAAQGFLHVVSRGSLELEQG